jgi:hypothetical protein
MAPLTLSNAIIYCIKMITRHVSLCNRISKRVHTKLYPERE